MRILELEAVLLLEILGYGALHGLAVLQLQGEPVEERRRLGEERRWKQERKRRRKQSYVWWLAGRRVTLHTLYFLFI